MMRIEFDEKVAADPATVYGYLRTPHDWTRLYGAFGDTVERGDGWVEVPMRRFPFPLVAHITASEEEEYAAWDLRGFFTGRGEIRIRPDGDGSLVRGFEEAAIPTLLGLGPVLERRFLEDRFQRLWAGGWKRLGPGWSHSTGVPERVSPERHAQAD